MSDDTGMFSEFNSETKQFDLLVFNLKVEASTEPVVERGLLNITRGFNSNKNKLKQNKTKIMYQFDYSQVKQVSQWFICGSSVD